MLVKAYRHWRDAFSGIPTAVWLLALVSLVNRCGSMAIVFLSLYLTKQLGYDVEQAGYALGCYGLGALVGTWLGGRLTDRLGYFSVMVWSLVLTGIVLTIFVWLRNFPAVCAAVFALSLVSDSFRPANSVAIARYSAPEVRTRAVSLYRMSINMGWTVAPALGGLLVTLGWEWLFWIDGLTCFLAAGLLFWFFSPKSSFGFTEVEATTTSQYTSGNTTSPSSPYRDGPYLAFAFFTLLNALVFMQFVWTVPLFFKEAYHWNERVIGLIISLNGLFVFLVEMPMIYLIEGRLSRLQFVRRGLLLYTVSFAVFLLPLSPTWAALLFIVAISFGEILVMPFSTNFAYSYAAKGSAGSYLALYSISYSIANIAAPLFSTQIIARWGYFTLWTVVCILALMSLFGFWLLERKTEPRPRIDVQASKARS
ncbi:MAG: MFS transporter [Saprospiraceae bacterium]|nr:MFS transporter [Saprospiraceae bacterium]MDW8484355.1 MFS transporter [Saprospiraceae bacterium]